LGFGIAVHQVVFGNPGYAHRTYFFRPAYGSSGATNSTLEIQNASASATPEFTTTHKFSPDGSCFHTGLITGHKGI